MQNSNQALVDVLAKQKRTGLKIVQTINLKVDSQSVGGIVNIPFIAQNANATELRSTFWIETVQRTDGTQFMQLQYAQTILLVFDNVIWPHVSVATLLKG